MWTGLITEVCFVTSEIELQNGGRLCLESTSVKRREEIVMIHYKGGIISITCAQTYQNC